MPCSPHYLFQADADWRAEQGNLAQRAASAPALKVHLSECFALAAEDGLAGLVVFGWRTGALPTIAGDVRLRQKKVVFIIDRQSVPDLEYECGIVDLPLIEVILLGGDASLITIVQFLPLLWSSAIIDETLVTPDEIRRLISNRFVRRSSSVERLRGDLENLRTRISRIPRGIPISQWHHSRQGRTALCLAAGPSLDRRIEFLKIHAPTCVVIVADIIASRLQQAGIPVDFVINVDSGEGGANFFLPSVDPHTTLIMPLNGHLNHDLRFSQVSYFGGGGLEEHFLGPNCNFSHGTTVGVATVGFAHYLGCSEIILLGHDLAYEDDAYYSAFAGGGATFSQQQAVLQKPTRVMVMGNGGAPVPTNYLFRLAIEDFSMIIQYGPPISVFNPNMNDGIGALLGLTKPMPEAWIPAISTPKPRPVSDQRVQIPKAAPDAENMLTWLADDAQQLLARWQRLVANGHSIASAVNEFEIEALRHPSEKYLNFTFEGFALHQLRALRQPDLAADHPLIRASTAGGLHALAIAADWLRRFDLPIPPPEIDDGLARFLSQSWQVSHGADDSDAVLFRSIETTLLLRLWSLAPDAEGPEPLSGEDGLGMLASLGQRAPRSMVLATLAWCALDAHAFKEPLAAARECGLLHEPGFQDLDWRMAAAHALIRLESGGRLTADIQTACAWHACHARLLTHLARTDPQAVARVIREQLIPLDDHLSSLLIHHLPDLQSATALLSNHQPRLGEATTLALAGRLLAPETAIQALTLAGSIRPLSRFRDQALAVQAEACLLLQRPNDALAIAAQIHAPAIARPFILRAAVLIGNWQLAQEWLSSDCDTSLLATVLGSAWKARQKSLVARAGELIDQKLTMAPSSDLETLASGVAKMLLALTPNSSTSKAP